MMCITISILIASLICYIKAKKIEHERLLVLQEQIKQKWNKSQKVLPIENAKLIVSKMEDNDEGETVNVAII